MKIANDIYLVGSGQIGLSNKMDCHVYLIDGGSELALIDSGVGLDGPEQILNNIRRDELDPQKIRYLLVTHSHADHAGGARKLKAEISCDVVAPEIEEDLIEKGSEEELGLDVTKKSKAYPQDYVYEHCKVDKPIKNGETISVGRYDLYCVQVPGHSPGPICVLLKQENYNVLFSSDVVFCGGTLGLGNWPGSRLEDYRRYISRLQGLSVNALFPGHFLWTLREGQSHINIAIENLQGAFVPPNFQHNHPAV